MEKTEAPGEDDTEEQHPTEFFEMTGAGKFDTEAGTATGQGSFAVFNGFDDVDVTLGGPTYRGTWKVTDFVSWTPEGGLQVRVTLSFKVGVNEAHKGLEYPVLLTITESGIKVDFGFELFASNTTGSAAFHLKRP